MSHKWLRLLAAIMILLTGHLASSYVASGLSFEVAQPQRSLADFDTTIGRWRGEDVAIEAGALRLLDGEQVLNREYIAFDSDERIGFHVVDWADHSHLSRACPHHPLLCYPANGWVLIEQKKMELKLEGRSRPIPVSLCAMRRGHEQASVIHYYQMGSACFSEKHEARAVMRSFWRQSEWPYLSKVQLHVNGPDTDHAWQVARDFLPHYAAWDEASR